MFPFIRSRIGLSHLRVSVSHPRTCSPLSSLATAPTVSSTDLTSNQQQQQSFTASYLINSCSLSPEKALSISRYISLKSPTRADSVLAFLKNHGFSKTQVSNMVSRCPAILTYDPENNFSPKFDFFNSVGLSGTDLLKTINGFPRILQAPLEKRIVPAFNSLRKLLKSNEKAVVAMRRAPLLLISDLQGSFAKNVQILREIGVNELKISQLVGRYPATCLRNSDHFSQVVEELKDMGLSPSEVNFPWAIAALCQVAKSTWEKKVELYKKWGCSEDDVMLAFSRYPMCMMVSEDKLTRIMDLLVNQLGYGTSVIVKYPTLVNLSFEKRILPRFHVYSYLVNKGLMKRKKANFSGWLKHTELKFLNRVIKNYEKEAPELLKLYQDKKALAK